MNREKAPFVLTPDFEYVMGRRVSASTQSVSSVISSPLLLFPFPYSGPSPLCLPPLCLPSPLPPLPSPPFQHSETFHKFEETAIKAYMIIRKNANMIINLFSMVRNTHQHAAIHHSPLVCADEVYRDSGAPERQGFGVSTYCAIPGTY